MFQVAEVSLTNSSTSSRREFKFKLTPRGSSGAALTRRGGSITTGMISIARQMFQVAEVSLKSTATGVCHFARYKRSTGIPESGSYYDIGRHG
jgi:hypothetical protein